MLLYLTPNSHIYSGKPSILNDTSKLAELRLNVQLLNEMKLLFRNNRAWTTGSFIAMMESNVQLFSDIKFLLVPHLLLMYIAVLYSLLKNELLIIIIGAFIYRPTNTRTPAVK